MKKINFTNWKISLSLLILFTASFFISFKTGKFLISTISLLLISIYSTIYNNQSKDSNIGTWTFTGIMFLFSILTFSLYLKKIEAISISTLFVIVVGCVFIVLTYELFIGFKELIKSKKILAIILSYIILAVLIISFFVGIYSITGDISYKGELLENDQYSSFNYYYFSANTFYSMSYGDFIPLKNSRITSIIETALGNILHVIIIGWILSKK